MEPDGYLQADLAVVAVIGQTGDEEVMMCSLHVRIANDRFWLCTAWCVCRADIVKVLYIGTEMDVRSVDVSQRVVGHRTL